MEAKREREIGRKKGRGEVGKGVEIVKCGGALFVFIVSLPLPRI